MQLAEQLTTNLKAYLTCLCAPQDNPRSRLREFCSLKKHFVRIITCYTFHDMKASS